MLILRILDLWTNLRFSPSCSVLSWTNPHLPWLVASHTFVDTASMPPPRSMSFIIKLSPFPVAHLCQCFPSLSFMHQPIEPKVQIDIWTPPLTYDSIRPRREQKARGSNLFHLNCESLDLNQDLCCNTILSFMHKSVEVKLHRLGPSTYTSTPPPTCGSIRPKCYRKRASNSKLRKPRLEPKTYALILYQVSCTNW
jgi:hypothetical protein